jgi:hypothetical protein
MIMPTHPRTATCLALACVLSLCAAAARANDDELTDFAPAVPPAGNSAGASARPTECAFNGFPAEFDLYAAGAYSGRRLSVQIDQSGHEATQFDVAVNAPGQPVVLMLGAYEPSVWSIGWTAGTRIAAVWVSGYHRQAVIGLPKNTPILNSSYEDRGRSACPYFYFSANDELAKANALAKTVLHKPIKMFYPRPADGTPILVGAPAPAGTRVVTSTQTKLEDVIDKTAPMAGPAGVQDAVRKGFLRKATAADYEAFLQVRERNTPKPDLPPIAGDDGKRKPVRHFDGYVVLKPFVFPAGLYGGNSTSFIIAQGVPMPSGNPGHSAVYDMNNGRCVGAVCMGEGR